MSSELDPELNRLATALSQLTPASGLNRDVILYRAAQAAAQRWRWVWPTATAASVLLSIGLAGLLFRQPTAIPLERVVYLTVPDKAHQSAPTSKPLESQPTTAVAEPVDLLAGAGEYLHLRQQIVRWGVESLPPDRASSGTNSKLLNNLFDVPTDTGESLYPGRAKANTIGGAS